MKSCHIKLKDGRTITGYGWDWKPAAGYMTVAAAQIDGLEWGELLEVRFASIESGTTERSVRTKAEFDQRQAAGLQGNPIEDVLELAIRDGWVPPAAQTAESFDPATSPGMTDLMVSPETIAAMEIRDEDFVAPDVVSGFSDTGNVSSVVPGFVKDASNETGMQVSGFRKE